MNDIEKALKEVKEELYSLPLIQEYFRLAAIVENDENLSMLDKEIREHQRMMCEHLDDEKLYFKEKEAYESLTKKLNENPIYQNYLNVKSEVLALLNEMKVAIE